MCVLQFCSMNNYWDTRDNAKGIVLFQDVNSTKGVISKIVMLFQTALLIVTHGPMAIKYADL